MESLIPKSAFRYIPPEEFIIYSSKSRTERYIFYNVPYNSAETTSLELYKNYINSKLPNSELPEYFCDAELLRLLYKTKFNISAAFECLITEIEWRSSLLPNSYHSLASKIDSILNSGVIYIHGRDCRYRPLIIINCLKIHSMHNEIDSCCYLLCYLLEFTKRQLLLAGKIETFMLITDLAELPMRKIPKKELKMLYNVFQSHFSSYLCKNFILNTPKSFSLSMFFSSFMDSETSRKTQMSKSNGFELLQLSFSPYQLEEKFGGNAPNANNFWPPNLPDGPFAALGEPEDHYLEAENLSESGFDSIDEKINLSLPFMRQENLSLINSSLKIDTDAYNVNVDIAISFEDIDSNAITPQVLERQKATVTEIAEPPHKAKVCCKNIKCTIV